MVQDAPSSAPPAPVKKQKGSSKKPRRLRFLPVADSYLLANVWSAALRSLGWFAGLFLAFILINAAKKVAQSGLPMSVAFESLLLQMPRLILFTLPASLLLGTVSTFIEMSSKGELTALMSGGMSLWRMLRAPLALSVAIAGVAFWLQNSVVPSSEIRNSNLLAAAARSYEGKISITSQRDDGTIERIVEAQIFNAKERTLTLPVIQIRNPDGTNQFQIKADLARWNDQTGEWIFINGTTQNYFPNKTSFTQDFDQVSIETDIAPQPNEFKRALRSARDHLQKKNYEMVTMEQTRAYRDELEARMKVAQNAEEKRTLRREIRSATFGIHDKIALPLVIIALVLVGMPLGVRPQRTAAPGVAMGLSLMAIMGYYFLWMLCQQWAKGGGAAPAFVAYLPPLVLALIGTFLIVRRS